MGVAQAQTFTFTSSNGVIEECRILPHIPGGNYSPKDVKTEQEYCLINFYDQTKTALYPKVWSNSPGTMAADQSNHLYGNLFLLTGFGTRNGQVFGNVVVVLFQL